MAHLLGGENLRIAFPSRVVFDGVTVGVEDGDRIGIVGRNGDGKSTLLSLLAGLISPDTGRVTSRRGLQIGMLSQGDELEHSQTVGHAVVGDVEDYVWASNPRIRDVIDGLVSGLPWEAKVGDLSGGQRRRVALAALLAGEHDVIFLDEPTNHLDIEGVSWLADHVKTRWPASGGGFLVVTHDRWFLDEVCTATWEVHDGTIEPFEGGYAAYVLQRVERDRMAASTETKRQNLMRKELAWLRRGPPARTSKPKFRIDAANELIATEPPARDSIALHKLAMQRLGNDVLEMEDVTVSYGEKVVLRDITWNIGPGDRYGILGVNGAGKSTLLGLITGATTPTSGTVKRGKTIRVATLTQQADDLDDVLHERVLDVIGRKRKTFVVEGKEVSSSQLLERLGFTSTQLAGPISELSGGQQRRLQLLLILLDEPNVLVMDEPTNDLDTDMLAAVEDLLDSWPGTLVVVSHDRYLIERVTDQQYAILDGKLRHLPGGVAQYVELRRNSGNRASVSTGGSGVTTAQRPHMERRVAQKEFGSVERKLQKLPAQIAQAEQRIAEHDQADYMGLATHVETLNALRQKQSDLETRWLELSEMID